MCCYTDHCHSKHFVFFSRWQPKWWQVKWTVSWVMSFHSWCCTAEMLNRVYLQYTYYFLWYRGMGNRIKCTFSSCIDHPSKMIYCTHFNRSILNFSTLLCKEYTNGQHYNISDMIRIHTDIKLTRKEVCEKSSPWRRTRKRAVTPTINVHMCPYSTAYSNQGLHGYFTQAHFLLFWV